MSDRMGVILTETQLLCRRLGDRVREVYRNYYLFQGELDRSEGDLTLVFESGFVLRLTGTSYGQDLVVCYDRWEDPLAEPLDEATREWVEQCGKWTEVCVNEEDDYRPLIGNPLVTIRQVFFHYQQMDEWKVGLSFHFSPDAVLFVTNNADTVQVTRSVDPNSHSERPLCSLTDG